MSWSSPPPMGAAHAVRRTQHRVACWASHTRRWPTAVVAAGADLTPMSNGRPPRRPRAFKARRGHQHIRRRRYSKKTRACARGFTAHDDDVEGEKPNGSRAAVGAAAAAISTTAAPLRRYIPGALTPSLLRTCAERSAVPCVCVCVCLLLRQQHGAPLLLRLLRRSALHPMRLSETPLSSCGNGRAGGVSSERSGEATRASQPRRRCSTHGRQLASLRRRRRWRLLPSPSPFWPVSKKFEANRRME